MTYAGNPNSTNVITSIDGQVKDIGYMNYINKTPAQNMMSIDS